MKLRHFLGLLFISLVSCQKDLFIDYPVIGQQVVIEGWIEQGGFPHVLVTLSSPYTGTLDSAELISLIVRTAKVTVSDGENTEILTLKLDKSYFPPFIYVGNELKGVAGKNYHLQVECPIGDSVIKVNAVTTIPEPVQFDSLWYAMKTGSDSLAIIYGQLNDNPYEKNYYRIFSLIKNQQKRYYPTLVSLYNDTYFNGKQITLSINKGIESYLAPEKNFYFKKGDSVYLKFCTIDSSSYKFWKSYDAEVVQSFNPFASSFQKIESNISMPGVGIWCGYGVSPYIVYIR